MKLNFADRLKQDKNFAREVDLLQRQIVFLAMGVDPEEVAAAWDGKRITKRPEEFIRRPEVGIASPGLTKDDLLAAMHEMRLVGPHNTAAAVSAKPAANTSTKK